MCFKRLVTQKIYRALLFNGGIFKEKVRTSLDKTIILTNPEFTQMCHLQRVSVFRCHRVKAFTTLKVHQDKQKTR